MVQMNETNVGVPEAGDISSPPKPEKYTVILVDDTHDHQEVVKRLADAAAGLEPVMAPVREIPLLRLYRQLKRLSRVLKSMSLRCYRISKGINFIPISVQYAQRIAGPSLLVETLGG